MAAVVAMALMAVCVAICAMWVMDYGERKRRNLQIEARVASDAESSERESGSLFGFGAALKCLIAGKPRIDVDRDLAELIDVLGLGMEAGLSFENAFALYASRFDTGLARECRATAAVMASGLASREEAMGELAERLGSKSFSRFTRISLRSVRFGSRLMPMLEGLSDEVRREYRDSIEEKASKAPTKMLVPTGMLILPAMLLLVCGPFLLELMEQF